MSSFFKYTCKMKCILIYDNIISLIFIKKKYICTYLIHTLIHFNRSYFIYKLSQSFHITIINVNIEKSLGVLWPIGFF